VDYLEHYFQVESQALDLDLDTNKAAEMNRIKAQILLLNQLNNYGYTPQTQLSTLMVDLQRRESELLDLFRASDGETAQDLRERLTVLAEAMEQIEGLEVYQIVLSDSVFRAQQKLAASIDAASQAYLTSSNGRERLMTREVLNSMRISERWLGRFYKPDERDMTLSELEAELTSGLTSDSSAEQIAQLAELKSIKANLDEAVKARLETDFENFKTNLQKQAKQVSDPDEKRMIEQRIKALQFEDFVDQVTVGKAEMFESLLADLTIKIDTNLFLYADIPLSEYPEPLLFEWDLGDGEKRFGQNVNHEYFEAGFYRVVLTMYDGVTSEQDLFTIRVIE
jgi:hypothetical protein